MPPLDPCGRQENDGRPCFGAYMLLYGMGGNLDDCALPATQEKIKCGLGPSYRHLGLSFLSCYVRLSGAASVGGITCPSNSQFSSSESSTVQDTKPRLHHQSSPIL